MRWVTCWGIMDLRLRLHVVWGVVVDGSVCCHWIWTTLTHLTLDPTGSQKKKKKKNTHTHAHTENVNKHIAILLMLLLLLLCLLIINSAFLVWYTENTILLDSYFRWWNKFYHRNIDWATCVLYNCIGYSLASCDVTRSWPPPIFGIIYHGDLVNDHGSFRNIIFWRITVRKICIDLLLTFLGCV